MKYDFMKTSWFGGKPFQWNEFYFNNGKSYSAYRFGLVLFRVYYENTKTSEPRAACAPKA
jgi:hypothetical protein